MGSEKILSPEASQAVRTHLMQAGCADCGTEIWIDPARSSGRCMDCARGQAGIDWPASVPIGKWHPGVAFGAIEPVASATEAVAYPAPVVSSRDGVAGAGSDANGVAEPWPGAAAAVALLAESLGWAVRQQYARGCFPNLSTGRPGAEYDSWGISMRSGSWGAYAVYASRGTLASWRSVMLWGAALPWFPLASVTDLRAWLAGPDRPAAWYDGIRERRRLAGERTKLRAKCNVGVHATAVAAGAFMECPVCGNCWPVNSEPWRKPVKGREGMS